MTQKPLFFGAAQNLRFSMTTGLPSAPVGAGGE
jgi:hypothetical protein